MNVVRKVYLCPTSVAVHWSFAWFFTSYEAAASSDVSEFEIVQFFIAQFQIHLRCSYLCLQFGHYKLTLNT